MATGPTLFLIDGSNQMYRAYHAIRGLTRSDGKSTNATYGFITMLRKLLADHQPQYIVASFDLRGKTFRSDVAADYKANRAPMPGDLAEQVPWVHEACEAMGVPILTLEGFEADDVIGTLATKAAAHGLQAAIVTGDKDFFQLVRDGIRVYNPKDEGTWYDAQGVKDKWGVEPSQVCDVLALMGDSIDNVKGVPGIGEKGATDLINTYGSLESLLAHASEIKNKRQREGLLTYADQARQSRELVTIRTELDVPFEAEKFRFKGADRERCYQLFSKMEFRTLVPEFAPTAASVQKDYALIGSTDELKALAAQMKAAGRFSMKVITDGTAPVRATLVGIAISIAGSQARYVPLGHEGFGSGVSMAKSEALAILGPLLTDPTIEKIGHDLKADLIVLGRHGVDVVNPNGFDTMIASYLVDANRSSQDLEPLALEQLGYKALTDEEVRGKGVKAVPFAQVPVDSVLDYAGERADLALQLAERVKPILVKDELESVYRELELPLVPILAAIERIGVRVDVRSLASQSVVLDREMNDLSRKIFELAGGEFNIGSPKQLAEVLFEKLQLPVLKRTGTSRAPSTAVEVLEELAAQHDICRHILDWRGLSKLKGTYIDALPTLVNPETGRVHTQISQAVAATGRLSSSDPNLQNIPIRTEIGRQIRSAFIADPGNVLISADYSQIELRVLAHLSGDETLTEAFVRGDDIHDQTATKVFGADSQLDPYELRRRAKIINYALLYGKTAFTLSKDIGVTQQAAQQFIDAYFAGFPRVRAFIDKTLEDAQASGVVKTMFGRRRPVPELTSRNFQIRAGAERIAVNMPIQGTAADILKRAMIDVSAALAKAHPQAKMILTVHDELLFESPKDQADDVAALVKDKMSSTVKLSVPLDVDAGIGENWTDAKG
ncbi:MAG TPA: DNA polymerase I [Vicinamibacterales bacterium]|nr:DNA polymerase I [Vicinamibacterales bacterium]